MKPGDKVKFQAKESELKLISVSGILYALDAGYRAYVVTDKDIPNTAIKEGEIVKVLLRDGHLFYA